VAGNREALLILLLAFSGVLGLFVGSFLNVCIFRLPRNCMSVLRPARSHCPKCRRMILWYDNIPVASWIALRAKCRFCREPISARYAWVELLTGALFFIAAWRQLSVPGFLPVHAAFAFVFHAWFLAVMVVCTFIDLEFKILPDELTLPGILIGTAVSTLLPELHAGALPDRLVTDPHLKGLVAAALGAVIGGGSIYFVGVFGKLLFRKEAMGMGDVKFMAMAGTVLGWHGVLLTFLMGCFLGALFGIAKFLAVRRMGEVPFGPFLAAGAVAMLLAGNVVYGWESAYLRYVGLLRAGLPR
jgi:leader peptidase (prepilin peptidase)/N-methyltransferase